MTKTVVGGGPKKVLYTLNTVRRIGLTKTAKALNAKNACKACGLGMGGQMGGMTNEIGEFPSVCNKSVQAQSTDIQPAIPDEIFSHPVAELDELSGRELDHLGRLASPVFKSADSNKFQPVSWNFAMSHMAKRFAETDPDRSFFYSSGRSSNEAGFLFQLLARAYGTNNVTNCSYYCHQATSVAMEATIGTGTSTVELDDLKKSDLVFVIGANPSSNHPRFIHLLKSVRDRGGQVIIINPAKEPGLVKFAVPKSPRSMLKGGDEIASLYLQPRIGMDVALFKGIAKAVLEENGADQQFIDQYGEDAEEFFADIASITWQEIEDSCGIPKDRIGQAARYYCEAKSAVFAWGMGMTHHVNGVENIEYISNLALLRGMIGRPGAGLLPLRGHSNVQGIGTIGVKPVLAKEVIAEIEKELGVRFPTKKGLDTLATMEQAAANNVDAALIMGGNLFAATPDSKTAAKSLTNIGFKAFLTTTLNKGHLAGANSGETLILPVTARDEEWEPTTQESMFNFVRLSDGGIKRHDNVRPEVAILSELGKRLLPDSPIDFAAYSNHNTIREAIAATIPGMEELKDIHIAKQEFHVQNRIMHEPVFHTPTGKAKFVVRSMPASNAEMEGMSFTLATIRSEGQFNSIVYEEKDSYRQTDTRWCVLMNQLDIDRLHLNGEIKITMRSESGEMQGLTVYPFDVPAGNILAYYPEANVLTSRTHDPRSKTPSFKSVPVELFKET
ncbi:MAG: FdhF/YdeP family oxidoreductase [Parasphingorhabdus sp.]|uniref:FdhF/YdeP family oxidoreductase n=1 Tax=Parasphingorhabdus sp. TaxID=2709688 RepID=UPI003296ED99